MRNPRLAAARLTEPTWRVDARCRSRNAVHFFAPAHPERKDDRLRREAVARALCSACEVRSPCLEYALDVQEPHGIWGGANEVERRRLTRQRAAEGNGRTA